MSTTYYPNGKQIHMYGTDNVKKLNRLSVDDLYKLCLQTSTPIKKMLVAALNKRDWK